MFQGPDLNLLYFQGDANTLQSVGGKGGGSRKEIWAGGRNFESSTEAGRWGHDCINYILFNENAEQWFLTLMILASL